MSIGGRGTSGADGTSGDFTIAPPSGTQPGDLLVLLDSEDIFSGTAMSGWTRIGAELSMPPDQAAGGWYRYAEDPVPSTYTVENGVAHDGSAIMTALYGTVGTLVVDNATIVKTDGHAEVDVAFNLQSIETLQPNSAVLALMARLRSGEIPGTPSGMASQGTHSALNAAGGHRVAILTQVTAGWSGIKFIEMVGVDRNSAAIAMAISESLPVQGDGDINGAGEFAASATHIQSGSAAIVGTGEVAGTAVALQEGSAAIVGTGEVATFPDPTVIWACPIVTNISPLELGQTMAAAKKAPVTLDLEMVPADLEPLVVMSIGEHSYWPFVAVRGEEFAPYLERDSKVTRLGDVYSLTLLPNGGWLKAPSATVGGFEEDETPASITPAPGAPLAATRAEARWTPVSFDLTPKPRRVPFIYLKFAEFSALPLVIFGGEGFAPMFADSSRVSEVGGVFSFSILPIGGWRDDPTIIAGDFSEAC